MATTFAREPLDPAALKSVCAYAIKHLVPPDDVIRIAAGRWTKEPFLISPEQVSGSYQEKQRYQSILSALYKGSKRRFDEAAPKVRGTRRTYFGRTSEEVYSTGNSNWPEKIPDSPWYVSVNNDGNRKARIIYDLMTEMEFSSEYSQMISSLCWSREARLPRFYSDALEKLRKAEPGGGLALLEREPL
jgi:negative regulator of replication initiation